MATILSREIGKKIADCLGIKNCTSLQVNIRIDEVVKVYAEFYPEVEGVEQALTVFKEYELVEKK